MPAFSTARSTNANCASVNQTDIGFVNRSLSSFGGRPAFLAMALSRAVAIIERIFFGRDIDRAKCRWHYPTNGIRRQLADSNRGRFLPRPIAFRKTAPPIADRPRCRCRETLRACRRSGDRRNIGTDAMLRSVRRAPNKTGRPLPALVSDGNGRPIQQGPQHITGCNQCSILSHQTRLPSRDTYRTAGNSRCRSTNARRTIDKFDGFAIERSVRC